MSHSHSVSSDPHIKQDCALQQPRPDSLSPVMAVDHQHCEPPDAHLQQLRQLHHLLLHGQEVTLSQIGHLHFKIC